MTSFQSRWVLPVRGPPSASGVDTRLGGMSMDIFGSGGSSGSSTTTTTTTSTTASGGANGESANRVETLKDEELKGNLPTPPVPPELGGEALPSVASEEHSKADHDVK